MAGTTRRKRPTAGETYVVVKDGEDGPAVRCRGCEQVVPFRSWWKHVCAPGPAPTPAPGATT